MNLKNTCPTVFSGAHSLNLGVEIFTPKFGGYGGRLREFLSSPVFPEISGIRWNLGEFRKIREISGKFSGNSVGFCMALNMNSVGIPRGFWGNAGFWGNLGFWGGFGRFGVSKGFRANSQGMGSHGC